MSVAWSPIFDEEIYGENIEVYLCEFKRAERQFSSLEELKRQLMEDIEAGKHYGSIGL